MGELVGWASVLASLGAMAVRADVQITSAPIHYRFYSHRMHLSSQLHDPSVRASVKLLGRSAVCNRAVCAPRHAPSNQIMTRKR